MDARGALLERVSIPVDAIGLCIEASVVIDILSTMVEGSTKVVASEAKSLAMENGMSDASRGSSIHREDTNSW